MIAIFLNELVNITSSYLKINYYRDVSEYNIRNNCNNIFCEAETARFNLAKNSYKLILPNDNFNSKIYYYALLFIFVTVFLMFLYKFWDYNKKSVEYYSDIDGRVFISYLFIFPYLFTFTVVAMLTVMIVRRYAPTDSRGYQKYFFTDNNESVNINTILDYSKKIITGLVVIWFVFSIFSNIPSIPINNFKYGTNLWYISLVYLVALTIILNFMIILSNIAFTFNDSTAVDLDKKSLIKKLRGEVMKLKVISKDELIKSLAIESDKEVTDKLNNLINNLNSANHNLEYYIKILAKIPTEGEAEVVINLKDFLTDSDADAKNDLNPETNINYKLIEIICNFTKYIILYFLKKEINKNNDVNYEKCLKMYKLFNYIDELDYKYSKMSYEKIKNIEVIDNFIFEYKLFLVVYNTSIQTDLSDNNIIDDKIKDIIYKYYRDYYESLSKNDQDGFKKITKKCHDLINHNNLNIDLDYNDAKIFNENISDVFNSNDKLNADTSYNSENTYYQKYFNIAGEENLYQKYNIGNYDYKNIEEFLSSLFLYVIFFIVFAFIIMFLQSDIENFSPFEILGREIVTPFVALFIVVLFIYIFINFNTKYNLYFIYGVLDSFYKRDLLQYNNIITPFIRLHDNNVENSRDYRKHYIITNVIASIISNRLNLHKISYDKDKDIFEENYGIPTDKTGDGNIVNEISNNFEELSDNTFLTTNAEYFKYISDYNEFKKYNSNIYKNIKSNYFGGDFNAASPQEIYNFIHNLELTKPVGVSDVMGLDNNSKVSKYIKLFIEKYINIIVRVIIECEYILENDEFYDDDRFDKFKKYFYFYKEDSDNKSIPYKFIIKLNTLADFNDFINRTEKSELKVIFEDQKKLNDIQNNYNVAYKIQDYTYGGDKPEENKLTNADIIVNFLKIVSHLKYNYEFLTIISDDIEKAGAKIILEGHTDFISTQPEDGRLTFGEYIKRIHNFHNMRLMYLITDHTPSPASLELIDNISVIKDTFRNTITKANFASDDFYDYFMNLKFICNLLKEYDSESGIENINSNYLKNVIKTTYKQINEENIRFRDRNKYAKNYMNGNNYNISPIPRENYNTKSDSIKNITNNANYFTGHGILFNYFANAVLILVIYNLGYN